MSVVTQLRARATDAINKNPQTLTFRRVTTARRAGGYRITGSSTSSETVRVYRLKKPEQSREIGGMIEIRDYGLLAEHDADIQVNDTVTYKTVSYIVEPLDDRYYMGSDIVSRHGMLKRHNG